MAFEEQQTPGFPLLTHLDGVARTPTSLENNCVAAGARAGTASSSSSHAQAKTTPLIPPPLIPPGLAGNTSSSVTAGNGGN